MAYAAATTSRSVPRAGVEQGAFIGLSIAHAAALALVPHPAVIGIGLWWNANTISHNFIHRPFFGAPTANRMYAFYLSLLMGVPQTLWRDRHLLHHANDSRPARLRAASQLELAGIAILWVGFAIAAPAWFLWGYLPGWALGLGLCYLQGHYEHARGTTSHYGRIYNFFFFNDGYHVEHHRNPALTWLDLKQSVAPGARRSRWPPVLRWLDAFSLEGLERLALRSPVLQRVMIAAHERAVRALSSGVPHPVESIAIVGGGLFPRSAIVARRVWPNAAITVIDAEAGPAAGRHGRAPAIRAGR
jgi:fatty acid desaturase